MESVESKKSKEHLLDGTIKNICNSIAHKMILHQSIKKTNVLSLYFVEWLTQQTTLIETFAQIACKYSAIVTEYKSGYMVEEKAITIPSCAPSFCNPEWIFQKTAHRINMRI